MTNAKRGRPRRNPSATADRVSLRIDPAARQQVESRFGSLGNAVYFLSNLIGDPVKYEGTISFAELWYAAAMLSPTVERLGPDRFAALAAESGYGTIQTFPPPWGPRFAPAPAQRTEAFYKWAAALVALLTFVPWDLYIIHYGAPVFAFV